MRLKRDLEELGAAVSIDDAGEKVGGNVGNLVAKFPGNAPASQPLLLSAHMDTVVPGEGIVPMLEGDILRTDGTTVLGGDDKSGVAIICEVMRVIKENGLPCSAVDVVFTICEEAGLIGAKCLDTASLRARTGLVLDRSEGVLKQMMLPFRFFAGGPLGGGRQYMPWIHRHDWVEMVRWLVETPAVDGPVNVTAPHPVTNAEFARARGHALRRPALLPAPGVAMRIVLGEMASAALTGQRALPAKAQRHGYHFRYPEIDIAFRGIFGD